VALLLATALFTGGVFFVKYKLEGLRATVEQEVQTRTGAQLHAGAVLVNGLRGLRIDEVEVSVDSESGPDIQFWAPVAYVHIDIAELFYGHVVVERVEVDGAAIRFTRAADKDWITPGGVSFPELTHLTSTPSFRLMGKNGTLELVNVVGDTRLQISNFGFDISRLPDSPDFTAKLSGKIAPESGRDFKVDLRYASMEDFDLRMACAQITAEDVGIVFPASQRLLASGTMSPSVRISGYPDMTLIVAFEAPFEHVAVRNQPAFIGPADGTVRGVAHYDSGADLLTLTAAKVESQQVGGNVEGSVSFAQTPPVLDLKLEAIHLPLKDALNYSIADRADQLAGVDLTLQEPYQLLMTLKGTTEAPVIAVSGDVAAGKFEFAPKDPRYPRGSLTLGRMTLAWDSQAAGPVGSFTVLDGTLRHEAMGLSAEKVAGTLTFDKDKVSVEPFNAEITGNPFTGSLVYDTAQKRVTLSVNGVIGALEKTLAGRAGPVTVAGSASIRGTLTGTQQALVLDGDVDATQAEIRCLDWFVKPAGVGVTGRHLRAEIKPGKLMAFSGEVSAVSCEGTVKGSLERSGKGGWRLSGFEAAVNKLDVPAVGRCIPLPYRIGGGAGRNGRVVYAREGSGEQDWRLEASAYLEDMSLLPEGGDAPLHFKELQAGVVLTNKPSPAGVVTLAAKEGLMPALRGMWFAPIKRERRANEVERRWTFELSGESVEVPPWKGTNFKGAAYVERTRAGFDQYSADIAGGGKITGSYTRSREDNVYSVAMEWRSVPVTYLIDQMNYPHVVSGPSTGKLEYSMDRDDPRTVKGRGHIAIQDGQFSADFLLNRLEGHLEANQLTSLPLGLKFSQLETDLEFQEDRVKTGNLLLKASGLTVTGNGYFITHGDMDYDLRVAFSPDLAEKIPALRDNLNLKGLRMAQQNVELAFNVKGPTFNPTGELTETPAVGITLVSGALELTSEAMKVIDIPRKVLVDLLRIGGGLVGAK